MSEQKITKMIYDKKFEEFAKRLEELQNPSIYYVSDLIYCSLKRHHRLKFPYLTFTFEPITIMGELVHRGLQEILLQAGFQSEYEVSRQFVINNEKIIVKGRIDAYRPGEVIEIKSSRSTHEALPYPHHVLQVKLYLELVGADKGILIYISPEKILEYEIRLEESILEKLLYETMNLSVAPRWDWECKGCAFLRICPKRVTR